MRTFITLCALALSALGLSGCPASEDKATPKGADLSEETPKVEAPKPAQPRALKARWIPAGNLPMALERPTALELPNGEVFAYGHGEDARAALWSPKTKTCRASAPSKRPRGEASASLLPDGSVLVTGGVHVPKGHYVLRSSERYDPANNRWSDAGNTGEQRRGHSHVRLGKDALYIIGGVGGGFSAPTRSVHAYNPDKGTYSPAMELGVGRSFHASEALGESAFIVVGGQDKEGPLKSIELCTKGKRRCRVIPRPLARDRSALAKMKGGEVLITGGIKRRGAGASEVIYDPGKNEFRPTGAMKSTRNDHTLTPLKDGRILAIGGEKGALNSAEVYDPKAEAWASASAPNRGRHGHQALLLTSGDLLIIGGVDAQGKAVLETELLQLKP